MTLGTSVLIEQALLLWAAMHPWAAACTGTSGRCERTAPDMKVHRCTCRTCSMSTCMLHVHVQVHVHIHVQCTCTCCTWCTNAHWYCTTSELWTVWVCHVYTMCISEAFNYSIHYIYKYAIQAQMRKSGSHTCFYSVASRSRCNAMHLCVSCIINYESAIMYVYTCTCIMYIGA